MGLFILVYWLPGDGWFVEVVEGKETVLVSQGGYPSALHAMEAGQVWVTLHRPGLPCITEVRSADGVPV